MLDRVTVGREIYYNGIIIGASYCVAGEIMRIHGAKQYAIYHSHSIRNKSIPFTSEARIYCSMIQFIYMYPLLEYPVMREFRNSSIFFPAHA